MKYLYYIDAIYPEQLKMCPATRIKESKKTAIREHFDLLAYYNLEFSERIQDSWFSKNCEEESSERNFVTGGIEIDIHAVYV